NGPFSLRKNGRIHHFDHAVRKGSTHLTPRIVPEEDVAVMAPTGGTTASPKAVMLTHRNLVANPFQLGAWSRQEDGAGGVLAALPFFHAYGLTVGLLTGLAKGATIHLLPRFEVQPVLNIMERQRPDLIPAVPAMLAALNRELEQRPRDLSFVRLVV